MTGPAETDLTARKKELMLLINQRLFEKGAISKTVYEAAKIKIVNGA